MASLASMLRQELDLQMMSRQGLMQDDVLQRGPIEISNHIAVVVSGWSATVVGCGQVLPAWRRCLLEVWKGFELHWAHGRCQHHFVGRCIRTVVGALREVTNFLRRRKLILRISEYQPGERVPVRRASAINPPAEGNGLSTFTLNLLSRKLVQRNRVLIESNRPENQASVTVPALRVAFNRRARASTREVF